MAKKDLKKKIPKVHHVKLKRHHKIIIGSFSTLVLVSIIVIGVLLNGLVVRQNIENAALKSQISELQTSTDKKINEITSELITTKDTINASISSTNEELGKIQAGINADFSGVVGEVLDSIVIVRTFSSQGSGFFVSDKGYIVTNLHILQDVNGEISEVIQIVTSDNKAHSGSVIGFIKELDLALLKTSSEYESLNLEESKNVKIGEKVIAIGTPEGLSFSATDGIVSAVGRTGFGTSGSYVQTNAELNPGNSGGPLLNQNGNVIGMNNFKLANSEGIGFALESDKILLGVNSIGEEILNETLIN